MEWREAGLIIVLKLCSSPFPSIFSGTGRDYEEWLAHSDPNGGDSERNGCVLGIKETYRRRKKHSVCRNGRAFTVIKNQSSCLCTREDYLW